MVNIALIKSVNSLAYILPSDMDAGRTILYIGIDMDNINKKIPTHQNKIPKIFRGIKTIEEIYETYMSELLTHETMHIALYQQEGKQTSRAFDNIDRNNEISSSPQYDAPKKTETLRGRKEERKMQEENGIGQPILPKPVVTSEVFSKSQKGRTEGEVPPRRDKRTVYIECPYGYFQSGNSATWTQKREV